MTGFGGVWPILRVGDLAASLHYYTEVLGFTIDWTDTESGNFASVTRGDCHLFLSEGDQGNPGSWVWIGVRDVMVVHREYLASGAKIRQQPTNFYWAYEMQVEDLDGNVLRMGSEPLADVPFGPWRDMQGALWEKNPEGGWTRMEAE
jgi:predicted enzyme related to lactoylglutathione lyase